MMATATPPAEITAAFITGVLGPLTVLLAKTALQQSRLPVVPKKRLQMLCRSWSGEFDQDRGPDGQRVEGTITVKLCAGFGRRLKGKAELDAIERHFTFTLKGAPVDGKFFRFEYTNENEGVNQFGCLLVELDDYGSEIKGYFVGCAPNRPEIAHGMLLLHPVD